MFQRLKGAIDSRIAEEQARQRQAQLTASPQRPTQRRRPPTQNGAPGRAAARPRDLASVSTERGPDPSEFEPEFTIGDDESAVPSRAVTPRPENDGEPRTEGVQAVAEEQEAANPSQDNEEPKQDGVVEKEHQESQPTELPTEVRVKLRKLEKLESRYGELLKAYRGAHARIQVIEPFEATLRENTPLTSINDPSALVEYLTQMKVKSDMVLEEFRRVSGERDDMKKRCEHAEEAASHLRLEVADLQREREASIKSTTINTQIAGDAEPELEPSAPPAESAQSVQSPSGLSAVQSPTSANSRIPSFSLFSPRNKPVSSPPTTKDVSEDLFSYDSELPRLEAEVQQRQAEVDELKVQVQKLKGDLAVARESTEGMVQSLEAATQELHGLRDARDKFDVTKAELEQNINRLQSSLDTHADMSGKTQNELEQLKTNNAAISEEIEKLKHQISDQERVEAELREQLDSRNRENNILNEKLYQKDSIVKDLEDSLAMAKSAARQEDKQREQAESNDKKLVTMQNIMDSLRGQLDSAELTVAQLRNDIEANKEEFEQRPSTRVFGFLDQGTDAAGKLTTRDEAIDFLTSSLGLQRESQAPEPPVSADVAVPPAENITTTSGKKKNKKKKKGKAGQATIEETEPDMPVKVSENLTEIEGAHSTTTATTPGKTVAELEQEIKALRDELESKAAMIDRLSKQLKDQEALQEEIETLRDDLLHQGEEHVEARDELKAAVASTSRLQNLVTTLEQDLENALQQASDGAEAEKTLRDTLAKMETDLKEAQTKALEGSEAEKLHQETVEQLQDSKTKSAEMEAALRDAEKNHQDAIDQLNEVKTKASSLQTDLGAAEQLAAARFKDITDLRELLSKAQPEMRNLRNELAELKSAKDDLKNKTGELNRLEARHEDLKADVKGMSKRLSDKDNEIKELHKKVDQEAVARVKLENELSTAQSDLRSAENRRQEATSNAEDTAKSLAKAKEEAIGLRNQLRGIEEQVAAHDRQVTELREEVSLKTALHGSSQSLVQSLRDQTHELNTQARESVARAENLEEELAEAQRMLSERTREGQTMRTLLNQAEAGTETRIRDMKERMDAAIEERDRVEDEASVNSRRMMREVEEAKSRAREAQRSVKSLEDEKEELETRQRDWKRRREELEQAAERATKEVEDVRTAMTGLREALDESERQVREAESQKADLRKSSEEARERLDKLTKANKTLTEELKSLQQQTASSTSSGLQRKLGAGMVRPGSAFATTGSESGRTSIDSNTIRSPPIGPTSMGRGDSHTKDRSQPSTTTTTSSTPRSGTPTQTPQQSQQGLSQANVDYVYLKNVLLQFLEQKDKNHQKQLIPVLSMLLHFDRKDEQKWMSAISAR